MGSKKDIFADQDLAQENDMPEVGSDVELPPIAVEQGDLNELAGFEQMEVPPTSPEYRTISKEELHKHMRVLEAILFASSEPVSEKALIARLPEGLDLTVILNALRDSYATRGINLMKLGKHWAFRTAEDLSFLLHEERIDQKRLSKAALEVLAIIAYHQPVTRAEIEEIRGVSTSKGTIDVLLETEWIRLRGRRRAPGRPVTYGTTEAFLDHFGIEDIRDLPGQEELKGAGLLQSNLPANFAIPSPNDDMDLHEDEDPLDEDDIEELGLFPPTS